MQNNDLKKPTKGKSRSQHQQNTGGKKRKEILVLKEERDAYMQKDPQVFLLI